MSTDHAATDRTFNEMLSRLSRQTNELTVSMTAERTADAGKPAIKT